MKSSQGFSLMELIVVVAIIGIIASIAVPSYQNNVMKSSRGEGMTAMLDIMRAQEDFFANNFTYTADLTQLNYAAAVVTDSGRYRITASACGSDALTACVRLTGTAQNGQQDDGNLVLDSRGNRSRGSVTGWTN